MISIINKLYYRTKKKEEQEAKIISDKCICLLLEKKFHNA